MAKYVIDPEVALTKLQGDALVTFNDDIIAAASDLIDLAPFEALLEAGT